MAGGRIELAGISETQTHLGWTLGAAWKWG